MKEIPVYLITGYLDSGKSTFVQQTLADPGFCEDSNILVISFEEGEIELEPTEFASENVFLEVLDADCEYSALTFADMANRTNADKIIIEYNGMHLLEELYATFPRNWVIAQQVLFFDSTTFTVYNNNMRNLTVDKMRDTDLIVFNRATDDSDFNLFHKVVRATNRQAMILYEKATGEIMRDEIEDPLPYDIDAPVIEIEDKDFAIFFRDLAENPGDYENKNIKVKVMTVKNVELAAGEMLIGRHIMTCCADDIKYCPMICKCKKAYDFNTYDWAIIEGVIKTARHDLYNGPGPIIEAISATHTDKPEDPVATFY